MKVDQLITISINAEERELLAHFMERNIEKDENFDEGKGSDIENKAANDFARKFVWMIQS